MKSRSGTGPEFIELADVARTDPVGDAGFDWVARWTVEGGSELRN